MAFDLNQFREVYFSELGEHLAVIGDCLAAMEEGDVSETLVREAYLHAHSIKGASATFEHDDVSARAGILANVFDAAAEGRVVLDGRALGGCRVALQQLMDCVSVHRGEQGKGRAAEARGSQSIGAAEQGGREQTEALAPEQLLAGVRGIVAEIREQIARMECINREHAALAARVEGLLMQFAHEIELLSEHPVIAGLADVLEEAGLTGSEGEGFDGFADVRKGRRRAGPVPKVRAGRRGALADEWEEH